MKRLLFVLVAALALGLTLASVALPLLADEPVYDNITLTDTDDNAVDFDVYPGQIGLNDGITNPVLVVTDSEGNVEMICAELNISASDDIRKEGVRLPGMAQPSLLTTVLYFDTLEAPDLRRLTRN